MLDAPPLPARFRVLARIGQGGMATVYLAEDQVAGQQVAIKVLLPHLRADPLIAARFRREMAAVRRIRSPHIVAVHDLIETDEVLCLVLDYLPGQDLKRRLRRDGALPVDALIDVAQQVLRGLSAAHQQGVVHRDIKPHNLLLDDEGRVHIADFGLARVDDLVGVTTHTMTIGTPEYLAPELLSSPLVDGRADLYSLGVTLFELATAHLPFRASSPMTLLRMHQTAEIPNPCALAPELPYWLGKQIQRAMAKEPEERFATADEWLAALEHSEAPDTRPARFAASLVGCRSCGASLLPGLATCVECGAELIELQSVPRGGRRVYIDAVHWSQPDALTFEQKYKIVAELTDLGATLVAKPEQIEVRLRNLPVVVADRLTTPSAERLADLLIHAGVPARLGRTGLHGALEYLLQLVRPGYVLSVLGCALVLGAGLAFRATALPVFWLQTLSAGLLISGVLAVVDVAQRRLPLARIERVNGIGRTRDPLLLRIASTLRAVHAPRLRSVLQRLVGRALELRERLERDEVLGAEMRGQLDHLVESALDLCAHCARIDDELSGFDPSAIHEQLQVLDEQIATAGLEESSELIATKVELQQRLASVDEKQREHVLGLSRLLDVLARLTALHAELGARQADPSGASQLSAILGQLSAELQAQGELEGSTPSPHAARLPAPSST